MGYEVEFTEEFAEWWHGLTADEQISVDTMVLVLEERGPSLGRPQVDTLKGSRISNLKELRVQHAGRPLRILFAFDPRRVALMLLGGDKTGDKRWYEVNIPKAEAIYREHLRNLESE